MVPGVDGKQRNHVEVDRSLFIKEQIEVGVWLCGIRADCRLVALPRAVEPGQRSAAEFSATVICDGCPYARWSGCANIGREPVLGAALHADAAKAGVPQPKSGFIGSHPEIVRIRFVERTFCAYI